MSYNLLPPELRNNENENNIDKFTYQNTGYQNDRLNKRILNIDSGAITAASAPIKYSHTLQEKFRIDKKCDIYLDSFTTLDCFDNTTSNTLGFLISFDEFSINNSYSNTSGIHNKLFIPNDSSADADAKSTVHKGKKLNYVATINPMEITTLNITITALDGTTTMFNPHGRNSSRFLMELIFMDNE
tara:strand:- start:18 stop:575 length:558 start_codon:yes stop_codon:yes gene_type:complete